MFLLDAIYEAEAKERVQYRQERGSWETEVDKDTNRQRKEGFFALSYRDSVFKRSGGWCEVENEDLEQELEVEEVRILQWEDYRD